ncbi:MAG TPA: PP2C family protein-serine/threonine phosphatase [Ktedonobacteraceae bacterium]
MTADKISSLTFARDTQAHEGHPERNEDTILVDAQRGLAAVFDGVGGSEGGDVASRLGARAIRRAWRRFLQEKQPDSSSQLFTLNDDLTIESILCNLLQEAQEAISAEGERRVSRARKARATLAKEETGNPETKVEDEEQEEKKDRYPETTVAAVLLCRQAGVDGYNLGVAHVGDSRVYLLRTDQPLQRLTRDDGYFTLRVEDHTINEEDAVRIDQATEADQLNDTEREIFNKRNGITQSLGHRIHKKNPTPTIHTAQTNVVPGDRILLCSDGIHDNLTDSEIEAILRQEARTTAARHLVQTAVNRSHEECLRAKKDDMSAIVITCNH